MTTVYQTPAARSAWGWNATILPQIEASANYEQLQFVNVRIADALIPGGPIDRLAVLPTPTATFEIRESSGGRLAALTLRQRVGEGRS